MHPGKDITLYTYMSQEHPRLGNRCLTLNISITVHASCYKLSPLNNESQGCPWLADDPPVNVLFLSTLPRMISHSTFISMQVSVVYDFINVDEPRGDQFKHLLFILFITILQTQTLHNLQYLINPKKTTASIKTMQRLTEIPYHQDFPWKIVVIPVILCTKIPAVKCQSPT